MEQNETRKVELENYLNRLEMQKAELITKKNNLKQLLSKEKKDVEKLNGRSLSVLFISVFGNRCEELSKEETEAYEAEVKYDCAKREVEEILYDIEKAKKEYEGLLNIQIEETEETEPEEIQLEEIQLEETQIEETKVLQEAQVDSNSNIGFVENQLVEILQVDEVVKKIYLSLNLLESQLVEINTWDFFDLLGAGQISDKNRIEGLDNAQIQAENVQINLRRLWTEIKDVELDLNVKEQVENFVHFSDYFYQGLFQDITKKTKIKIALEEIKKVRDNMEKVQKVMYVIKSMVEDELKK